jgi:hypothetical protein
MDFHKYITKPIIDRTRSGTAQNLRLLLQSVCLRRTTELINLPRPREVVVDVHLSEEERMVYDAVKEEAKAQLEDAISSSQQGSGTGRTVLHMMMNLRRVCNHGTMDRDIQNSVAVDDETNEGDDDDDRARVCPDCRCEIMGAGQRTPDGKKVLCGDCYCEWERKQAPKSQRRKACMTPAEIFERLDLTGRATKIELLVNDVERYQETDKWCVFSVSLCLPFCHYTFD